MSNLLHAGPDTNAGALPKIAGIGSRKTPKAILEWMKLMGAEIVKNGFWLASGNASGADQAWATGANTVNPRRVHICLPWDEFERDQIWDANRLTVYTELPRQTKRQISSLIKALHPAGDRLSDVHLALLGRNALIVHQASAVIGWMNPERPGGTGMAYILARRWNIPVFNVATEAERQAAESEIKKRAA